jgi:hypothetical protein
MDFLKNPYTPNAGTRPPELVGRDPVLAQAHVLLERVKAGKSEKSMLLTGLRGVGKTVLLNEIKRKAEKAGYRAVFIEASEEKPMGQLLASHLRSLLFELSRMAGAGDKARRGLAVLRSFVSGLKLTYGDFAISLDIEPEEGSADSGDLEIDLPNLIDAVGEAAIERKAFVALLIDEIQCFREKELGALIMAMHRVQQKQLPIILVGAGLPVLPVLPGLAGDAKSYAERLFNFPEIGALSADETAQALQDPARENGVEFEQDALVEIHQVTKGYPYFVQEWGSQSWNLAAASPIRLTDVQKASPVVESRLDLSFFRVRYDRLTPGEKRFLRAMAELGPGPHRTGTIAEILGLKRVESMGPRRAQLIKKGMIYSPVYGELAFTVPLFDEFMKRAIPEFP